MVLFITLSVQSGQTFKSVNETIVCDHVVLFIML